MFLLERNIYLDFNTGIYYDIITQIILKQMSKKNKAKANISLPDNPLKKLKKETRHSILAVTFFLLAILFILASFDLFGPVGQKLFTALTWLSGMGYYLLPIIFIMLTISFLKKEDQEFSGIKTTGALLLFLAGLGILSTLAKLLDWTHDGGNIGAIISKLGIWLFGSTATLIILGALVIISILILFESELTLDTLCFWRRFKKSEEDQEGEEDKIAEDVEKEEETKKEIKEEVKEVKLKEPVVAKKTEAKEDEMDIAMRNNPGAKEYVPPPLSLLANDSGKPGTGDIKANANIIKRTLQKFGIDVEMDEVTIGPSVTRYAIKPAEGVKLSKIVSLQDNLAYALAAHPIRIEAPIPGKSLVGIEIPNTTKTLVGLASLLSSEKYSESEKPLLVSLGKGISGDAHFASLGKMPHVLIAGATGSGKSVTIHAIITSLLYRNSPELLKFIMIDPKRVELTLYNKIPHLLTPVITDAKKTILALKWAGKEMDRRYDILEERACKDIDSYHKNVLTPALQKVKEAKGKGQDESKFEIPETMPFIVVVIDELADIMMTYPRELESSIVRLAQMSRAVGIHLILSTQRPSVNVITGLIKANIPARIALQVVSQIDSRTILDGTGAEKLLGCGDMLYLGGEMSKPVRIQSAFISETEVKKVVKYLSESYQDEIPGQEINFAETAIDKNVLFEGGINDDIEDDDELYETDKEEVIKAGKASTSYIQRKLSVGYARAARLIDLLEERGVIGPGSGAKPREILIGNTPDENNNTANLEETADKMLGENMEKELDENGFEEPEDPKQF
jgi:S-DNA-T family DNA segregation ATPase FtsK/SpoIIIE